MNAPAPQTESTPRPWLARADQAVAAGVLVLALVALAGYWIWTFAAGPGVIDIDTAPPRVAEFKVDLNRAGEPELAMLPEVGEGLAHRIVEYRQVNGPFHRVEELRRIQGIGPKTLAAITPYLLPLEEPVAANRD